MKTACIIVCLSLTACQIHSQRRVEPSAVAGCLQLYVGAWSPSPSPAEAFYLRSFEMQRVRLSTARLKEARQGQDAFVMRAAPGVPESNYDQLYWWRSADGIHLRMGESGVHGAVFTLRSSGDTDSLSGTVITTAAEAELREFRATVSAHRVSCVP